jgi:hypothetical protein
MTYKVVHIKKETAELINQCKQEFLSHHPEMKQMPISYNKIIYEMAVFYLKC